MVQSTSSTIVTILSKSLQLQVQLLLRLTWLLMLILSSSHTRSSSINSTNNKSNNQVDAFSVVVVQTIVPSTSIHKNKMMILPIPSRIASRKTREYHNYYHHNHCYQFLLFQLDATINSNNDNCNNSDNKDVTKNNNYDNCNENHDSVTDNSQTLQPTSSSIDNSNDGDDNKNDTDKAIGTTNISKSSSTSSATLQAPPQSTTQSYLIQKNNNEYIGIGGKNGYIYDVNKLKSNLVQKSIKQFKKELLTLLISSPNSYYNNRSYDKTPLSSLGNTSIKKSTRSRIRNNTTMNTGRGNKRNNGRIKRNDLNLKNDDNNFIRNNNKSSLNNNNITNNKNNKLDLIDEKIAALISTNPVKTTTDSNLLEGEWDFAYSTNNAEEILKNSRIILAESNNNDSVDDFYHLFDGGRDVSSNKEKEKISSTSAFSSLSSTSSTSIRSGYTSLWKLKPLKNRNLFSSHSRLLCLENLDDDEDPYMIDYNSSFNGLMLTKRHYKITGLSRTNLQVQPISRTKYLLGKQLSHNTITPGNSYNADVTAEIQFIYLDSDLCVTKIGGESKVLNVYTKNDEWKESRKNKIAVLRQMIAVASSFESPFRIRRKITSLFPTARVWSHGKIDFKDSSEEAYKIMLRRVHPDKQSKLTVIRLGDIGKDKEDEDAWEGDEDPFVHLSADERQEVMKRMSLEEISEARRDHKRSMMKLGKNKGLKRQMEFKRPSFGCDEDKH